MEQILSQDEVDALLKGISGGDIEEPEDEFVADSLALSSYDFTRQQSISQLKMPAMDVINDSFLRMMRTSLANSLRRVIDITAVPMEMERFGAFVRTLPVPSSLQIFKMDPVRGNALFVLEPKLVFALVETFLGGTGARNVRIEGRDFTSIEQRLIQRVINLLLSDMEKAWYFLHPVQVQFIRSEINPQFAKICEPDDVVLINRYEVDMDRAVGSITCCIPLSNLESVKGKLITAFQREQSEEDLQLSHILQESVKNIPIDLNIELGKAMIPAGDIIELQVGDIIQLDRRKDDLLPCYLAGVRKFMGMPGIRRGSKAFLIKRKVINQERD